MKSQTTLSLVAAAWVVAGGCEQGEVDRVDQASPHSPAAGEVVARPACVEPDDPCFSAVGSGRAAVCALSQGGAIVCAGSVQHRLASPPGAFRQIAVGGTQSCALREDGTLGCWERYSGEANPGPEGAFTQFSLGDGYGCGVRPDRTLSCWGADREGEAQAPVGAFLQVSAGARVACAVAADETLVCWGSARDGLTRPPSGPHAEVSVGTTHACARTAEGMVRCWGDDQYGQASPPKGTFASISAGGFHTCGLDADGVAACWGYQRDPASFSLVGHQYVQLSAGGMHSCGVRADGVVECSSGINLDGPFEPGPGGFADGPVSLDAGDPCEELGTPPPDAPDPVLGPMARAHPDGRITLTLKATYGLIPEPERCAYFRFQGRGYFDHQRLPEVEVSLPPGVGAGAVIDQDSTPAGFRLAWAREITAAGNDPLCFDHPASRGECPQFWAQEVIDGNSPAAAFELRIDELDLREGGRIRVSLQLSRYSQTRFSWFSGSVCCGERRLEVDTVFGPGLTFDVADNGGWEADFVCRSDPEVCRAVDE